MAISENKHGIPPAHKARVGSGSHGHPNTRAFALSAQMTATSNVSGHTQCLQPLSPPPITPQPHPSTYKRATLHMEHQTKLEGCAGTPRLSVPVPALTLTR